MFEQQMQQQQGGFMAFMPLFQAFAPVFSSLLGGGGQQAPQAPAYPQVQQVAPPPAAAAPPPAPEVVTEAAAEPVTDVEAARVRNQKRRKASEEDRLFQLGSSEDEATVLTKSLLGE